MQNSKKLPSNLVKGSAYSSKTEKNNCKTGNTRKDSSLDEYQTRVVTGNQVSANSKDRTQQTTTKQEDDVKCYFYFNQVSPSAIKMPNTHTNTHAHMQNVIE